MAAMGPDAAGVSAGDVRPTPATEFPKDDASETLMGLHRGDITGRAVLVE